MKRIILIGLLFGVLNALAAAQGLYTAEVEVADESVEARAGSISKAFEQVLIQATGDRQIASREGIKGLIAKAPDYVQQFKYRQQAAADANAPEQRLIQVQFDKGMVDRALSEASINVWTGSRPKVLVWLAQDQAGTPGLVTAEANPELVSAIQQTATNRAQPLQLPLMDLSDLAQLTAADLWAGKADVIQAASARYPHQLILVGRIRSKGKGYSVDWLLLGPEGKESFQSQNDDLANALAEGIHKTADFAAQNQVSHSTMEAAGVVELRIQGVRDAAVYAQLISLLQQQDQLSELMLTRASGTELDFKAKYLGSLDSIRNTLVATGLLSSGGEGQGQALLFVVN